MAGEDGKVVFKYVGDTSGVDKANTEAEQKVKGFGSRLAGIAKGIGTAIAGALAAAGAALVGIGKRGIELASDLREVQNVVDVTFGDGAENINEFAKSAGAAFGLSELQAKEFTGSVGAMLKSMQVADEQVLEMSMSLAGLAGDMASFYNLDHDTAWQKIRSGIAGETEPLKQLGINMSVANLEAYALSQGITKAYEEMTEAEKVTLRYNYLLSVTADAQGDFARTADEWANQLRTAQMNVDGLAASFGETLLPALQPVLKAFNDVAVPKLHAAFEKMAEDGTLDKLGEALGMIAELLSDSIADILPIVIELLSALLPVAAEIAQAILPPILEIMKTLTPLISTLMELLGPLIELLSGGLAIALGVIADALSIIVGLIGLIVEGIKWLLGKGGDFQTYLNMITKPFSTQGSTYQAGKAQVDKTLEKYGYYNAITTAPTTTVALGPSDDDLTDEEWYNKYIKGNNARGTSFWRGGRTWVGELGPELIDLPVGTRIYPADMSAAMAAAPSISNRNESTVIGQLNVYPDSENYLRILRLVEASEAARQTARAGGNYL
ncbi:MAG: hypothetical protein GXW96_12735 [Christensenellaceae bacterium]|nr:hypothetical protein [Christensenellaceae bacterium]